VLCIHTKIAKSSKWAQVVWKFPVDVPENPKIFEFPESEPFNQNFRDENQMERKTFPKFGYNLKDCPLFRKFCISGGQFLLRVSLF